MDDLTWPQLMDLLDYWQDFPPVHVLLQGIASGLSGQRIGRQAIATPPKHVGSAEDLMGLLSNSGVQGGVIYGR